MPSKYERKTDPDSGVGRPRKEDAEVTSELLTSGAATIAQLAQLFETDAKTLPKRMKMVQPVGTRKGNKVYSIRQAAQFIVTPGYEIEEYIRQMSAQELPPLMMKEFWNGQRARLEYEIKLGNHWPTEDVIEFIGELGQAMRMVYLLLADDVNRETSLTDGQRKAILRLADAGIANMQKTVKEKFEKYHADRPAPGRTIQHVGPVIDDDDDDDGNVLASPEDEEIDI